MISSSKFRIYKIWGYTIILLVRIIIVLYIPYSFTGTILALDVTYKLVSIVHFHQVKTLNAEISGKNWKKQLLSCILQPESQYF